MIWSSPESYLFFKLTPEMQASDMVCHYWFDQDDANMQSNPLGNGLLPLNVDGLIDGIHTLHVVMEGNELTATQSFLFLKITPELPNAQVQYHYWFDWDDANMQSGALEDGLLHLDVNALEEGMHTLHLMMEGNKLTASQSFLFLKMDVVEPSAELTYFYWFDFDDTNIQSDVLGNGLLQLDVNELEEGIHTLHVMLEGNDLASVESFMFLKINEEEPSAELTYFYWFDENETNLQTGLLGDGILQMDVNDLEEGEHVLNIVIEGNNLTATQSFEFTKLLPSPCPYPDNLEANLGYHSLSFSWTCPGENFRIKYYNSVDPSLVIVDVVGHSYELNDQ